jgi:hypothetical protein
MNGGQFERLVLRLLLMIISRLPAKQFTDGEAKAMNDASDYIGHDY